MIPTKGDRSNHRIRFIRPALPELDEVSKTLRDPYGEGYVTLGTLVERFESDVCQFTGAAHAVAVSSCTAGLTLCFAAMGFPKGSEVIVPSFTFAATVQALLWNELTPVYVDCEPGTMTIDPDQVIRAISAKSVAIYPVNVFGVHPDVESLNDISNEYGLPLIFDSAQAFGATYQGAAAGSFGTGEVFSLSPTKVVTSVEGGLLTTSDKELAASVRSMRDYGKGPDGDTMIQRGMSARMSELHAAVGLLNLGNVQTLIRDRLRLIEIYADRTRMLDGCAMQEIPGDRVSSGNYFTLRIGSGALMDRDSVHEALAAHDIESKRYYRYPVHAQPFFQSTAHRVVGELPHTWAAARECLALPLYPDLSEDDQNRVCQVLESLLNRRTASGVR